MENKKLGLRPIDVAMELGIGITVARDLIKCGDMKSIKIGRSVVVPRTELEAYLARMATSSGALSRLKRRLPVDNSRSLVLRPAEVAAELKIGVALARGLIKRGDIKSILIGRSVVVPRTELEVYLARMMQSAGGSPDAKGNPDAGDDEGAKRSSPRD